MNEVLQICAALPEISFAPGELILQEGGRTGVVYVLIEGKVEILRGEVSIDTSTLSGAVFGEMSILLDKPHTATVKALLPSRLYKIDDLPRFVEANPGFSMHLCRLMAKRLNNLTTYLIDLKEQFSDHENHLGMVDEVLGTLLHHQA